MEKERKTIKRLKKEIIKLRGKVFNLEKMEARRRKADALRESEERYRALVDSTEDSIYLVGRNCTYLFMNKKHLSRLGLSKTELGFTSYSKFHSAQETKEFKKKINKVFRTGKSAQYEYQSERDNRYFLQTFSPVKNRDKKTIAATIVSKDITHRKQAQEALKQSEERFRALFNQAYDSIFLLKYSKKGFSVVDANYAASNIHGYSYKELIGKTIEFLDDDGKRKQIKDGISRLMKGEPMTFEAKHVRKDGSDFPIEVSAQLIKIGNEPYVLAIDRDISERKRMEEELRALSLTDGLTGLYNRRGCSTLSGQLLKIANRESRGVFMLYADVDNLKEINDKLGHKEGDRALSDIANVLKENYRESDVVARIGGDEFVVVPVGFARDSEELIKSRLQKALDAYFLKNKRRYKLSISIGLAYYDPRNPCSIDELLNRADKLMYQQKLAKKKEQLSAAFKR